MPGARRARSLVCKMRKHTSIVTTVTPETPGIPRAMVLTVSFVLSPATGLSCHRHWRDCGSNRRQLDASVGASVPHDFAVHLARVRVRAKASTASRAPTFCDDRETPLERRRDANRYISVSTERSRKIRKIRNKSSAQNRRLQPAKSRTWYLRDYLVTGHIPDVPKRRE